MDFYPDTYSGSQSKEPRQSASCALQWFGSSKPRNCFPKPTQSVCVEVLHVHIHTYLTKHFMGNQLPSNGTDRTNTSSIKGKEGSRSFPACGNIPIYPICKWNHAEMNGNSFDHSHLQQGFALTTRATFETQTYSHRLLNMLQFVHMPRWLQSGKAAYPIWDGWLNSFLHDWIL